ncbi:MAG: hypothetical protein OIF55_03250 [Amphritea sp.]|nr:hypothetical protein [Amphritea sp.]
MGISLIGKMCHGSAVVLLVLGLTACGGQGVRYGQENYVLDLNSGRYCIEDTGNCYSLSLIGPAFGDHEIAKAYGLPKGYYSWQAEELAALVIAPPQQQYEVEYLGERRYRIPPRYETHLVWDTLAQEYYHLYRDDDGVGGIKDYRPPLRRY